MIKYRKFPEHNYKAVYHDGKTLRFAINPKMPIGELEYPEFFDVKITSKCFGQCPWCYMDSKPNDFHSENSIQKIKDFFGVMNANQRPFQVAIGGGEPTSHPEFTDILKSFYTLGICPNYTTNGMWIDQDNADDIIYFTKLLCGGVAVSCHPHLRKYWERAAKQYVSAGIKLNFHIIISDKESVDDFIKIYDEWNDKVEYFVLLPYGVQGRAEKKDIDWEYFCEKAPINSTKLAFGANFHPHLTRTPKRFDVSLYEPEILSKFLDLMTMKVYKSSFDLSPIN